VFFLAPPRTGRGRHNNWFPAHCHIIGVFGHAETVAVH
jgi:hypothetical protein